MPDCSSIQKSLAWCQGRPELPGVKRRIYYISKGDILQWPVLNHDANGRLTTASYAGDFILRADAKWKYIDILPDKSQLTSDPQGEYPSQTQLNKLVAVHPGVGKEASEAAAYLNNNDNVFLVADMRGAVRVVGSEKWITKSVVNQDLGQGATGSTSTTITVEATDECPAPFYAGTIDTDEGTINPGGNPNQATGGAGSGGQSGSGNTGGGNTGGGSTSGGAANPTYNNTVVINGSSKDVSGGSVSITGPLTSLKFTGSHMLAIFVESPEIEDEADINSSNTSATWSGNVNSGTVKVRYWKGSSEDPIESNWFTITVNAASNNSDNSNGPVYNNKVNINNNSSDITITDGGNIQYPNYMTCLKFTGNNMVALYLVNPSGREEKITVASDGKSATWRGEYETLGKYSVYRDIGSASSPNKVLWFTITLFDNPDAPYLGD